MLYDNSSDYNYGRVSHTPHYNFFVSLPDSAVGFREYKHEGQRYIEGRKGTEYVLNFYNGSNEDVEIVVSVDGLSIVDGKPAGVESTGYVVRRYQTIKIPGWRINADKVAKFVFRPQGDKNDSTYVEALRSEGVNVDAANQGVIGCLVFKKKEVQRMRGIPISAQINTFGIPDGAMYSKSSGNVFRAFGASGQSMPSEDYGSSTYDSFDPQNATLSASSVGTGFGEDKTYQTRNVDFTRHDKTNPCQTFVVMYDTISGLRRRGVPVTDNTNPLNNAFPSSPHLSNDGCRIPKNR